MMIIMFWMNKTKIHNIIMMNLKNIIILIIRASINNHQMKAIMKKINLKQIIKIIVLKTIISKILALKNPY
jgi:hypothetical protein